MRWILLDQWQEHARTVKQAAEAKSVCSQQAALPASTVATGADASAQVLQLEHAEVEAIGSGPAQALTALSRDSMQWGARVGGGFRHELSEMLVARREQAARRLVSSLLAGSFEGFLRTALRAWRKVQAEAALMRAELDGTRASEAASLSKLREELQDARSHMLSEAEAAIKAQEMLTTLSHEPVQSWRHELSEMFMARREQAARRLVSSLLASSFEVFLRAALRAWWKAKADANAMASSLVLMRFFSAWCQKVASRQEKLLRRVVSAWAAYAAHNSTELSRAGGAANAPAARHPTPSSGSSSGAAAAAWDRFHDMDLDSEPEL
ncbi:unnamed protein product [Symbiodinium natans]|uniref:Uncharacterized protein n=1 Tax=Symbiodinium natans TaxID=878477 RepID=A0A812RXS2_9DINO|nr:unnamed protein product [Symbiodinium natans]